MTAPSLLPLEPRYREVFARFLTASDEWAREQALLDAGELAKDALTDAPLIDPVIALHMDTQAAIADAWQGGSTAQQSARDRLARGDGTALLLALMLPHELAQRAHHERRWQREHDTLAAMFEQTDELIVVLDADGLIDDVNPAFVRATGWSPLEAAQHSQAVWPHDLPGGHVRRLEAPQRCRDGSQFTAEWSVCPIVGRDGTSLGRVCVGRDVGRRQRVEESLRENDKLRAVATLAGGIAHDFNNLLGSILGLAELCALEAPPGSRLAHNLARIALAGERAAQLVRQLLDFSRRSPAAMRVQRAGDWRAHAQPLLRAAVLGRATLVLQPAADAWVQIDPVQMEQVLLNLVRNAADATRDPAREVEIVADLADPDGDVRRPAHHLRLRVIDHGDGIEPAAMQKIFEPFYTTKPVGEGTGLGLAAVHGIVTSHGGVVRADSRLGEGSTFSVFLPLCEGPQVPAMAADVEDGALRPSLATAPGG